MANTSSLPTSGTYPVSLSSSLFDSRKRKRDSEELVALRYNFKPASVTSESVGLLSTAASGSRQVTLDTTSHGVQAYDVREEQSKSRECVLVYNEATHSFTIHALPTTMHLTLNRAASGSQRRPGTSGSTASTAFSASMPLASARPKYDEEVEDAYGDTPTILDGLTPAHSKRPRLESDYVEQVPPAPARPTKGSKGVARKAPPTKATPVEPSEAKTNAKPVAKKPPAKTSSKAGAKKGKAAAAAATAAAASNGKIKSAEIIDDSDEEYDLGDEGVNGAEEDAEFGEDEDEDEFAKMVGESLAAEPPKMPAPVPTVPVYGNYDDSSDDSDDDEDDDDEALGGARLVVRQQVPTTGDDDSEWL